MFMARNAEAVKGMLRKGQKKLGRKGENQAYEGEKGR